MHRFNTKRKFGSLKCYEYIRINGTDYLFTEDQLKVARNRAKNNPEDIPKKRWYHFWRKR